MVGMAAFALAACGSRTSSEPVFDSANLNDNVAAIRAVAHDADLILVAKVKAVSTLTLAPSGVAENRQAVHYDVVNILRGFYNQPEIDVDHLLVAGSRQTAPGGGLSALLFSPGKTLILMIRRDDIFYEDGNENFSAIPYSAQNEKALLYNM